jgi:ribonuclease HII
MLKSCKNPLLIEAGIDEVARGCLFGRVYAAVVIWNPHLLDNLDNDIEIEENIAEKINLIKDSKKLSKIKRQELREFIEEHAIDYGIAYVENDEIDKINILNASLLAMHKALDDLTVVPDALLVDGNCFKEYYRDGHKIDYECVIKGDNTYTSIAAASILAKVYHDEYIKELCKDNEDLVKYDLLNNMGYGTLKHRNAIKKYGVTCLHRKSFKGCY